ncbi:hypothetical protein BDR03DRAFT_984357 [Suillus americanus]|nr:hypothetical protein BDR03DRAFT_984357 [Suillus americanus]
MFLGSVGLFMEEPFEIPPVDPEEDEPSVRFRDLRQGGDTYVIKDHHHGGYGPEMMEIPQHLLEDPHFHIDRVYWLYLGQHFEKPTMRAKRLLRKQECRCTDKRLPMGLPIEDRVKWWLENYIQGYVQSDGQHTCTQHAITPENGAAVALEPGVMVPAAYKNLLEHNYEQYEGLTDLFSEPSTTEQGLDAMLGSLLDLEQIRCKLKVLEKPLTIQLAVQGSRSKVNYGTQVRFQYQDADYSRYFDIINLQNYDLILGTPFLYQHSMTVGFNSSRVMLGSMDPLPLKGSGVMTLESRAVEVFED